MKIILRNDSVEIDGYVNAVERDSKTLWSRIGQFIERICAGAFGKALKRNDDVRLLLNHEPERDLGGTGDGTLELKEDAIGLRAHAVVTDPEVIRKARADELVGWSFGYYYRDVEIGNVDGIPLRYVRDMDLVEVSLLDSDHVPAFDGTLVIAREADQEKAKFRSVPMIDTVEKEEAPEQREEAAPTEPEAKEIDYSIYENMISEMKGERQ